MKYSRIPYIDGLKGIAITGVVLLHYTGGFGLTDENFQADRILSIINSSPVRIFYNGWFWLYLFLVISALIIADTYFSSGKPFHVIACVIKRYLRLLTLVLFTTVLSYILYKCSLIKVEELKLSVNSLLTYGNGTTPTLLKVLFAAGVRTFINGNNPYNQTLWFLKLELFGSTATYIFLNLFGKHTIRYFLYVVLFIPSIITGYSPFLLGVIISDIFHHKLPRSLVHGKLFMFIFLLGLFFGSYPQYSILISQKNTFYGEMAFGGQDHNIQVAQFYYIIASFFIVISVRLHTGLRNKLSCGWLTSLGKMSYSVCAIHYVIAYSFSAILFLFLSSFLSYTFAFLLTLLISFPIIISGSYLLHRHIELPGIKFSERVYVQLKKVCLP